jgi:dihydroxyacetone kinase DhaKLM complex PTS-EIIA-like component DhaM
MTLTAEALWLDDLLDGSTRVDIEKQLVGAIDKDRTLRNLVVATPILRGAIIRAVMACLHFDPLALLADGWCTARDIRACRNADKPVVLKLGAHSIERDMHPAVTVDLGSEKSFALDVGLSLAGNFKGVELTISDSKLVSVGSGTCSLSLQIKVAGRTVVNQDLKTLELPGEYRFAQPLALR